MTESHVSAKSYGSILHIALVSQQMLERFSENPLKKPFFKGNNLNKIFNKNTVKVIYNILNPTSIF